MPHARSSSSTRGKLNPNRSDLTKPTDTTVPGQGYGIAAEQRAAQQAIPMGQPSTAPTIQAPATPQSGPTPQPTPQMPMPVPGANGPISRPTERPGEPVTAGLPMGPGIGPEGLTGIGAAARQNTIEQGTLTHLLTSLAAQPGSTSAIRDLAARAQNGNA